MGSAVRWYAGVGSKKTPAWIRERMEAIAERLARRRDSVPPSRYSMTNHF